MEYRNLGRTGVKVSPLCLGCWNFGQVTDQDQTQAIIDRALDAGVNFIDTANSYGRGTSETMVGQALDRVGPSRAGGPGHQGPLPHGRRRPERAGQQPAPHH